MAYYHAEIDLKLHFVFLYLRDVMRKLLIITACLSAMFCAVCFANPCDKIVGHWSGEWVDYKHTTDGATLDISQVDEKYFYGTYVMSNGKTNEFHGTCKQLTPNESYLSLQDSPPHYNPCRGLLIQNNNEITIHFYCFNPNDSGYFTKD